MDLYKFLQDHSAQLLTEATEAMMRTHAQHYDKAGCEQIHQRLKALYTLAIRGVKERNLGPMIAHADSIARERFNAGYDLWEVQTAFNVLEESIWKLILTSLPADEYAEALGLISTVLGAGKDTLARRYVSLASKSRAPSLNLEHLFTGTEA